ncbi:hypothetical protein BDN71DRAFT_1514703 [Pleurotus eryngii]|uniref:Zn(2)-C6 fungal-type domain-containing protein n=1 Tax=Pleurotus eryngii TaxID=5323 RepID=A0A9P5ZED7_PLEER|nr:hypothetical protein BDN71DRAFT_1514703 [Pleurotus eryngii]
MASSSKRARESTGSNVDSIDVHRRRDEKRRREDMTVEDVDERLPQEEQVQRKERAGARKSAKQQRAQKVVAGDAATEAHVVDNGDEAAEADEQAKGRRGKRAAGKKKKKQTKVPEAKGPVNQTQCASCIIRKTECHARVVKGARTCWECKHGHLRCGAGEGIDISMHRTLGKMTAELFDLSIGNARTSIAIERIEGKIDDLTAMMKVVMEAIGGVEAVEAQKRQVESEWTQSLGGARLASEEGPSEEVEVETAASVDSPSEEVEVETANAPSTSDSDEEGGTGTDEEEDLNEEKGKGRAFVEETDEEEHGEDEGTGDENEDEGTDDESEND